MLPVLQTQEARAEAASLMGVHANLCTPKNGDILVAATQVRTPASSQPPLLAAAAWFGQALHGRSLFSWLQTPLHARLAQD